MKNFVSKLKATVLGDAALNMALPGVAAPNCAPIPADGKGQFNGITTRVKTRSLGMLLLGMTTLGISSHPVRADGTKTGSWSVSFADGWSTFGWSGSPEKGTNGVRSWSGTYDSATNTGTFTGEGGWFSSTWTPGNGNWIPDIGRGSASGPLNKMAQNYNVQWNGTGIIIPNGSSYTFGLKFNLAAAKADGTSPGWKDYDMTTSYEAYIVTHTNKVPAENRKFIGTVTTPSDPVPYDCYTAEGYLLE